MGTRRECGGEAKEISPFTHTQLSLATFKGGMRRGALGDFCQIVTFLAFGKLFATY